MPRSGRGPGPLDGATPQANDLAAWLRKLTKDRTVRDLEANFRSGRTQWSCFLNGRKLIPSYLLDDLVTALIPEPRLREVMSDEGRKLLEAAEQAALGKLELPPQRKPGSANELYIRLDEARKGELRAQQTLLGTTHLIGRLLAMVASLQERCQILEDERDRAQETARAGVLAEVGQQLVQSEKRKQQAEACLAQARRKREEAEGIRIAAQQLAETHRRALEELRQQPAGQAQTERPATEPEPRALVPLYEYDAALEQADDELDAHAHELSQLRQQVGLPLHDDGEQELKVVRGHVVDSADNRVSSRNAADDGHHTPTRSADGTPDNITAAASEDPQVPGQEHAAEASRPSARVSTGRASAVRSRGYGEVVLALLGIASVGAAMVGFGYLTYLTETRDISDGIHYHAGDKPSENRRGCSPTSAGAACYGYDGWSWTLPGGGKTSTVLASDGTKNRLALSGALKLDGHDCDKATVSWKITTTDPAATPIDWGTLTSGGRTRSLSEALPHSADRVELKAQRTDRGTCNADLEWHSPALDPR